MRKLIFICFFLVNTLCFGEVGISELYDSARASEDIHLAIEVNRRAIAEQNPHITANSYFLIGYIYKNNDQLYEAVSNYFRALDIYRELDNQKQMANVIENIANIYSATGFHQTAIDYYQDALSIKSNVDNQFGINKTMAHIAFQHQQLGDNEEALKLYQEVIELATIVNDSTRLHWVYNNVGRLNRSMGNYDEARSYYEKALHYSKVGEKIGIYNNIGYLYLTSGDTSKALSHFTMAVHLLERHRQNEFTGTLFNNLGDVFAKSKPDSARIFYEKGYAYFKQHKASMSQEYFEVCQKLKAFNRNRGELQKALTYSDDIENLTSDLFGLRSQLKNMNSQYQVEAATYKFASEEKEKELSEHLLVNRYFISGVIFLTCALVLLCIVLYRKNRKIQFAKDTAKKIYQVIHST